MKSDRLAVISFAYRNRFGPRHTKMPWRATETNQEIRIETTNRRTFIAALPKNSAEDARLICAAPELLELLQFVIERWDKYDMDEYIMTKHEVLRMKSLVIEIVGTETPERPL